MWSKADVNLLEFGDGVSSGCHFLDTVCCYERGIWHKRDISYYSELDILDYILYRQYWNSPDVLGAAIKLPVHKVLYLQ